MGAFDANKGQSPIYGPNSTSAPSASYPLVVNSDGSINVAPAGGVIIVTPAKSGTGTESAVSASASAVTILAANTARLGATVVNDSATGTLYLLLSTQTPTTSLFTVQMGTGGSYYEVPFGYTGIIKGIWDIASGNARVTEFTA